MSETHLHVTELRGPEDPHANAFWVDGGIDRPTIGLQPLRHAFDLEGWIAIAGSDAPPELLLIFADGSLLTCVALTEDGQGRHRFSARIPIVGCRESWSLRLEIKLENGMRLDALAVEGRRSVTAHEDPVSPQPIVMSTLGRSGSTLLANLMAGHPRIAYLLPFEAEARSMEFWGRRAQLDALPAHYGRMLQTNQEPMEVEGILHTPGHFPRLKIHGPRLEQWIDAVHVPRMIADAREGWMRTAREFLKLADPGATHLLEKHSCHSVTTFCRDVVPEALHVLLVRDFRDIACSWRSYTRKRDLAVGQLDRSPDDIRRYAFVLDAAERMLRMHRAEPDLPVVRYEDLVIDPVQTLSRLFTALDLPLTREEISGIVSDRVDPDQVNQTHHRTTDRPEDSLARWQRDLEPNDQRLLNEHLGPMLEAFGYEVPAP